jgi:hypothetical protein
MAVGDRKFLQDLRMYRALETFEQIVRMYIWSLGRNQSKHQEILQLV